MDAQPRRVVPRAENVERITAHRGRRRDIGQGPSIRPPELERAIGLSFDLVALLVDRAVVPAAERGEVRQGRGASLGPVANVMALAEPPAAAGEATAAVAMVKCPP